MKTFRLRNYLPPLSFDELPFFLFVTLALGSVTAWTIVESPEVRSPLRLIPFVVLMIIHIGLYWISYRLNPAQPTAKIYLVVQGLLALLINWIGQNMSLPFGLFMGLIGLTVGMYKLSRTGILFIGMYLIFFMFSYVRLEGMPGFSGLLVGVLPSLIFVILYVMLYNRQTEARAQAQQLAADLEAANRQLSEYAARVEDLTLTNERQRMARELHDTLSQGLAGLILQLEAVDAHLSANRPDRARAIVLQAMAQARVTLEGARRAIDDLRQQPADLSAAVQQDIARFTQSTGIPCHLEINLDEPVPPGLVEPAQRAIAEALVNIARHAQASQTQVSLSCRAGQGLEIMVQDNGVGFDPQAALGRPGHYGLLGIRERSRLAGGTFSVQSTPGSGTRLYINLPVPVSSPVDPEPQRSQA